MGIGRLIQIIAKEQWQMVEQKAEEGFEKTRDSQSQGDDGLVIGNMKSGIASIFESQKLID
jgi:hypothetical protein